MIVELFGPPGSGKTTFSHELAAQLRARGLVVELALSQRPAENAFEGGAGGTGYAPMVRRLVRPLLELMSIAAMPESWNGGVQTVATLFRLLPQSLSVRSLRLRQYLLRLHAAWHSASLADSIVIFDQGFVQAVYSLACVFDMIDADVLGAAIETVPQADLAIEIGAPLPLLQARLAKRLSRQGRVERLLERDALPTVRDALVFAMCKAQLRRHGRKVIAVTSGSPDAIADAIAAICQSGVVPEAPDASVPRKRVRNTAPADWLRQTMAVRLQRLLTIAAAVGTVACLAMLGAVRLGHSASVAEEGTVRTTRHYASQASFDAEGHVRPHALGFDLADVSSPTQLGLLPAGVQALVWVGLCKGADAAFQARIRPFLGRSEVFGFYLMDEPDPWGRWNETCRPEKLREEVDWIRAQDPRLWTFVALMNIGPSASPSYRGTYNPHNSHVDLYGIAAYPCRVGLPTCDLTWIDRAVEAAVDAGIDRDRIVPIFQAFGGGGWKDDRGGRYALPTAEQARALLDRWAALVPHPVFDYAYSWGPQKGDESLRSSLALQAVFKDHNSQARRDAAAAAPPATTSALAP